MPVLRYPAPHETIGPYTLLRHIGTGAGSRIYKARHKDISEPCALKVAIHQVDIVPVPDHYVLIQREAQAALTLNHPHIIRIYDVGEEDPYIYLAMQLIEGGDVRQRFPYGTRANVGQVARMGIQLARALDYAHAHGVIHRDVKPSNVLILRSDTEHYLLADFGIAKVMALPSISETGSAMGTPEYMAPEQARGKRVSPATDYYSLGCLFYDLLTGRYVFSSAGGSSHYDAISVCYQHVAVIPEPPSRYNRAIPPALDQLILSLLEKDPDARPQTAQAVEETLAPWVDDRSGDGVARDDLTPTAPRRGFHLPVRVPPPKPPARRHDPDLQPMKPLASDPPHIVTTHVRTIFPTWLFVGGFILFVLLVGVVIWKLLSLPPPPPPPPGQQQRPPPGQQQGSPPPTQPPPPNAATLTLIPTGIHLTTCANATAKVVLVGGGPTGAPFDWNIPTQSDPQVIISPNSGVLARGKSQTIAISHITRSGYFIISSPGVIGSPDTVTITCG